jgi:trans-2,3-dihydro-3-hydroxyanthranilate isomerase
MRDTALPVLRAGPKRFVPLSRRGDLWSLSPCWDKLASTGRSHGVLGFFVFTRDADEVDHVAHGRFFAPAQGIREDPVTGSANGPLADYLTRQPVIRLAPGNASPGIVIRNS